MGELVELLKQGKTCFTSFGCDNQQPDGSCGGHPSPGEL
jgi:hypothetical protein